MSMKTQPLDTAAAWPCRPDWYVVYCRPLHERQAAAALSELLGLTVYLPEVLQRVQQHSRLVALFPRYLFVAADLAKVNLSRINAAPGVLGLVAFGEMPRPIEAEVIDAIRTQVEHLNTAVRAASEQPPGRWGAEPYAHGRLAGLEAVFHTPMSAEARARLLLDFLRRVCSPGATPAPLDASAASHRPKRVRRTRGRGRPISRG